MLTRHYLASSSVGVIPLYNVLFLDLFHLNGANKQERRGKVINSFGLNEPCGQMVAKLAKRRPLIQAKDVCVCVCV